MVLLLADQDLASTETIRQCLAQHSKLSRIRQQTCVSVIRQLPARSQAASSAAIVLPSVGYAAVLAAALGDWQVWLCAVVFGLTVQVFADLARWLLLAVERLPELPVGNSDTCQQRKVADLELNVGHSDPACLPSCGALSTLLEFRVSL